LSASDELNQTVPGDRVRNTRVWLRFGENDVEVPHGQTLVGRSPQCHVVVDDPLVSRQHARITVNGGQVSIEDLGSANGVLVNGERLSGAARSLISGDRISIGKQTCQLFVWSGRDAAKEQRAHAQTLTSMKSFVDEDGQYGDRSEPTRKGDAIDLLTGVADKVLALGRGEEAERILSSYLRNLLQVSKARGEIDTVLAEKAATYAVRIAEATSKGSWIDYAFELYSVAKRPLPAPIVDRLYEVVRKLGTVSATVFRQYLSVLRLAESELGPADRFLMRRIEGLEALGVLR
jgi:predicted component of type VI protein secretion system